jgi:hypothetical protein
MCYHPLRHGSIVSGSTSGSVYCTDFYKQRGQSDPIVNETSSIASVCSSSDNSNILITTSLGIIRFV